MNNHLLDHFFHALRALHRIEHFSWQAREDIAEAHYHHFCALRAELI